MNTLRKPGASLALVGAALFFVVSPIISKLPLVGGLASALTVIAGIIGMVGGAYLVVRSIRGTGA